MILNILLTIFLLFLLRFSYRYIFRPYYHYRRFLKSGFTSAGFFPLIGEMRWFERDFLKYKDQDYTRRTLLQTNPTSRGLVTNLFDSACIHICDTSLKMDFFHYKNIFYEKNVLIYNDK